MTIPFGRLNVTITLSRAPERHKGWEEMMAIGMDDLDLARLNQANSRDPVHSPWTGVRWLYGPPR
jgi:hypothetical protein